MKKKKLLYSELAPSAPTPKASAPAAPVPAASAPAAPAPRNSAPVDLARALAAARAAEAAPAAPRASVPVRSVVPVAPVVPVVPVVPAVPVIPLIVPETAGSRSLRERARARSGRLEILLVRIGDERFAIDLAAVEVAIDISPVHYVPEMPPAMLGVITVRGTLTSVYSPAAALGLSLHDGTSALIFRRGRSRLAIVVDEVDDVTSLDLSLLRDAPGLDAGDGIVLGVVRQHDALLALVDTDALLAACQAVPLLETA